MSKIQAYFDDYASHHRHPMNKVTHYIGIPMILFSLLGMLSQVVFYQPSLETMPAFPLTLFRGDLGVLLWAAASAWYLSLDWKIGLPFSLLAAGFYFLALPVALPIHLALFVVGWIFQGIGHAKYEKTRPAFMDNVLHLLIGPLWIFAKAVGYLKKP
jgi:uncharacterized membrane protein YGL010W